MAEILGRWVDDETLRMPAANAYTVYYTAADDPVAYGLSVCNGEGADAHVSIYLVPGSATWSGGVPPPYSAIHKNVRIEADGVDGNSWVMPVTVLDPGDRLVVWTSLLGVTFLGHGWKFTSEVPGP